MPRRIRSDTDLRSVLAWAVRAETGTDVDWQDLQLLEVRCWPRLADVVRAT